MVIKCHSAFVHYNMFHNNHSHGGGNNYGSIFNVTHNCGGTGFWGGLGAGLGLGVGNLLGGFLGNMLGGLGNMFGGFGMGGFGLGGLGMGGFGGLGGWGNGLSGLFGGGNASRTERDYSEYGSRRSSRSNSCDCGCKGDKNTDPTDADCKKIADFQEEINKLTTPVTEEKYNDLKTRIAAARAESEKDTKNKDANLKSYDELLKSLDGIKNGKNPVTEVKTQESPAADDGKIEGVSDDDLAKLRAAGLDNNAIRQAIKTGLPVNDIIALIKAGLKPEDLQTIKDLGIKLQNIGDKAALSLPSAMTLDGLNKLKAISDARNIAVAVANNPKATEDQWIAGKLDDIKEENGKLSYTVNCKDYGVYDYKYQVQQIEGNKYSIDAHSDSYDAIREDGRGHQKQSDYEFNGNKLYKQGSTVISKWYL